MRNAIERNAKRRVRAWVLLTRKGTMAHRRVGWNYVACMLWLNVSALEIRPLTGRYSFLSSVAVIAAAAGFIFGNQRRLLALFGS